MSLTEILLTVIPLLVAMAIATLVSLKVLRREYYLAAIPFALIAVFGLLSQS
ncbi:MAG: hypothetical protein ACRCSU_12980 [Paracoccaceae bacterium]